MLEIRNVSKNYGNRQALKQVNLTLEDGIYGLLGANGAGKTTLIHIITGLLAATDGQVLYNGTNISKLKKEYRNVLGYMPQYPTFYPNFTAEEFLRYMCVLKGIPKKHQKQRIKEMLERVNLMEEKRTKIGAFSGGMRQRIGIAQAILNDPAILILDEPTAGLDPAERIRFRNFISNLSSDRIIILATHIVQDVEYIANQVLLLHQGELAAKKKPFELIEELKGKVVVIHPEKEELESSLKKHIISNVFYEENQCSLRMIVERTTKGQEQVTPNLEDVFLYYTQQRKPG